MRQFFKFMLASVAGTLLTLLLLFFVMIGMIASIVAMADKEEVKVKQNSLLVAKFNTPIVDRAPNNPFEGFNFSSFKSNRPIGLNEVLKNIEKAATDPNIDGIYLELSEVSAGMGNLEEVRNKLVEFKESGKFIISYAEYYSQSAYYLASVSDEIYLNPDGMFMFKGLYSQLVFLKNMLNKIEVEPQIIRGRDNKYKSAVEPLMNEKMSEANREQMEKLLDGMWGGIISAISESRNISLDDLNRIADNLEALSASNALKHGFVDGLVYKDEILAMLREKTGKEENDKIESVSIARYTSVPVSSEPRSRSRIRDRVAIIYAIGEISGGEGSETSIGSDKLSKTIREARTNENVKAIVMRVNSPGGSALASEVIRREVELAAAVKPFVVSMGNVAASGGYWISTSADYIFADPSTVTGSIGVFGVIPNMKGLFNNKFGITFDKAMTNKNADFVDVMEPLKSDQRLIIEYEVSKIYDNFLELVADSRGMTVEEVDKIAQGRVWTGADALEIGLVDEIGGIEASVAHAAALAGLGDEYRLLELPEQKDPIQQILSELTGQTRMNIMQRELGEYYSYIEFMKQAASMKGIQARLPFMFTIQ
jgi:protease IV